MPVCLGLNHQMAHLANGPAEVISTAERRSASYPREQQEQYDYEGPSGRRTPAWPTTVMRANPEAVSAVTLDVSHVRFLSVGRTGKRQVLFSFFSCGLRVALPHMGCVPESRPVDSRQLSVVTGHQLTTPLLS